MRFGAIRHQVILTTPHQIQKMSLNHGPAIGRHFQALGKLKNQRSCSRKTRCFVSVVSVKQLVPEFYVWNKLHFVLCGARGSLRIIFFGGKHDSNKTSIFRGMMLPSNLQGTLEMMWTSQTANTARPIPHLGSYSETPTPAIASASQPEKSNEFMKHAPHQNHDRMIQRDAW